METSSIGGLSFRRRIRIPLSRQALPHASDSVKRHRGCRSIHLRSCHPHPAGPAGIRRSPSSIACSGSEIFLKLETLQPIGSFKIRGAHNADPPALCDPSFGDGVWTVSAGNAAQGVALAARVRGRAVLGHGDGHRAGREDSGHRATRGHDRSRHLRRVLAHRRDPRVGPDARPSSSTLSTTIGSSPGNGTAGLEILEDLPDVDAIIAPLGGGGLLAGVASAVRALRPAVQVFAAEPETAASRSTASLRKRPRQRLRGLAAHRSSTVREASPVLATMWPLLSRLVDGSIVVTLADVAAAMRLVAERCHVIAEGAAGCAVAAALTGRAPRKNRRRSCPAATSISRNSRRSSAHVRIVGSRQWAFGSSSSSVWSTVQCPLLTARRSLPTAD